GQVAGLERRVGDFSLGRLLLCLEDARPSDQAGPRETCPAHGYAQRIEKGATVYGCLLHEGPPLEDGSSPWRSAECRDGTLPQLSSPEHRRFCISRESSSLGIPPAPAAPRAAPGRGSGRARAWR